MERAASSNTTFRGEVWWEHPESPWPPDHVPTAGIETSLWRAFAVRRRDPADRCTVSAICRDAGGASRTSLSPGSCTFPRLRAEIVNVQEARARKAPTPAERTEERIRAREERYGGSVMRLRKQLRAHDSLVAEYLAKVQAAEAARRDAVAMVARFLGDVKAGRLVMVDGGASVLAEAEALLGGGADRPSAVGIAAVETGIGTPAG